ncbi:hypothetical protein VNO77_45344 [Canavalia gladiata]|uniref:Transmembrane protein n=1 Tax=Canavalia gladiata TaxID=3824 RepID=A0AAN9JL31_CANGL
MPRCGFFWLISYDGFCDDSQNPNNNVSCLVWRLQRGCSGVHGCLVPFDILNASRCIISSCWWFHPWFRVRGTMVVVDPSICLGMGFILVLMMAFGVNSKTVVNKGVGCLVMLDDGSWVNRETLVTQIGLLDFPAWWIGIGEHPTTLRAVFSFPSCASSLHVGGSTLVPVRGTMVVVDPHMLRHGFHSRANDGFWGELQNRGQ